MTRLNRPVKRTACGLIREAGKLREIVVVLRPPNVLGFRAKGCRKEYQLTTQVCYSLAVRAAVQAEKQEHMKKRKKKKKRRRHET